MTNTTEKTSLTFRITPNKFLTRDNRDKFGDFVKSLEAGYDVSVYLAAGGDVIDNLILAMPVQDEALTERQITSMWRMLHYWINGRDDGEVILVGSSIQVLDGPAMTTLR